MKIALFKFIFDTDNGTGCDLFLEREKAVDRLFSCAKSWGYEGDRDEAAIDAWKETELADSNSFWIESGVLEIPDSMLVG